MKRNEGKIFIFIASVLLGILISTNIVVSDTEQKIYLNPTEYVEAYNKKMKLTKEIPNLREKILEYSEKLQTYEEASRNNDDLREKMAEELNFNDMVLGKVDVVGEGITITIKDAPEYFFHEYKEKNFDPYPLIVHDNDIINVVNDLKNAGAEVIAINGQRIINQSDIFCSGPFIEVNGIKSPVPFIINAIGNKEEMTSYVEANDKWLSFLELRNIRVDLVKSDEVKIYTFNGLLNDKYLNELMLEDKTE